MDYPLTYNLRSRFSALTMDNPNPILNTVSTGLIAQATALTVGDLLRERARISPENIAIIDERNAWTYRQFNERVNRLANAMTALGIKHGDRVGLLAENRAEYLEVVGAGAKIGAIVCALNWRLAANELEHCIQLTTPNVSFVSQRHAADLDAVSHGCESIINLDNDYDALLMNANDDEPTVVVEPEDGLLIMYTSGTTGLPKGALISHRAEVARMMVNASDQEMSSRHTFVAWPPMFHMASTEQALHLLCLGGKVQSVDGFDLDQIMHAVETEELWWLVLMPGMVEQVIAAIRERGTRPKGIRLIGAMADLVPLHQIAQITELLDAPYVNSFGATETGIPPLSKGLLDVGVVPNRLSKQVSSMCQFRLVDEDDNDVADGKPGELVFRGPTLFSGYWNAPEVNANDFRGGWFHMGDCFVRNPDGTFDFVDRVKYMIKSGGENIYPAEIERVILSDSRVEDAVVVRAPDDRWGEVPVAFVARNDSTLTAEVLEAMCLQGLARYKRPRQYRFVEFDALPRSTTGKIQRHEVEKWIERDNA
ncbi:MAG: AMP-binding protein [Pseudomonadota bacterium]